MYWNAQEQRAKALAKKREKERQKKRIHLQRLAADVVLTEENGNIVTIKHVRMVMNDISENGIGIFSPRSLDVGQSVTLAITQPYRLAIRARVAWCQPHQSSSRILSEVPYTHRIGLEFLPATPAEKQQLQDYCKGVKTGKVSESTKDNADPAKEEKIWWKFS